MWVASPRGFSEMTIQPARHECHACCLQRAEFMAFQPVVDNTRVTRVEQVVSSFHKSSGACNSHGTVEGINGWQVILRPLEFRFATQWKSTETPEHPPFKYFLMIEINLKKNEINCQSLLPSSALPIVSHLSLPSHEDWLRPRRLWLTSLGNLKWLAFSLA